MFTVTYYINPQILLASQIWGPYGASTRLQIGGLCGHLLLERASGSLENGAWAHVLMLLIILLIIIR